MTDVRDPHVRALVVELLDSSPPPPPLPELSAPRPRGRHRRLGVVIACTVIAISGAVAAIVVVRDHERPTETGVGIRSRPATRPPLLYGDISEPPPLRIAAGPSSVDVTTTLGCWFSETTDGHGYGRCADGSVDASRFRLVTRGRRRVTLRLPIAAQMTASLAAGPAPTTVDHALPPVITGTPVALRQTSANTWELTLPDTPPIQVLLVTIKADTTVAGRKVSGDAYYGLELDRS